MKHRTGIALLILAAVFCFAFSVTTKDSTRLAKQQIVLRKIGHELLLHAGDSTSRVLPVTQTADNIYQIRFENDLAFKTDSLVKIVETAFDAGDMPSNYIVNVRNCAGLDVVYGYAILRSNKEDLVACLGRAQPKGCYLVEIQFDEPGMSGMEKGYLVGGLALVGLVITRVRKVQKQLPKPAVAEFTLVIGNTIFNTDSRELTYNGQVTNLTEKEARLLRLLVNTPNVIVERSKLQKNIWEDEGVIVGRSLDMFISKLRKKLEADDMVEIKNVHGRGYVLSVNATC